MDEPLPERFEDRDALGRIIETASGPLYRFLFGMLGCKQDAEDALQETYLRARLGGHRFQGGSSSLTWLTGIALNVARERLRCRQLERWLRLGADMVRQAAGPRALPASPDADAIKREQAERVRQAVAALPERERAVVAMHDWESLSHREIADLLGCAEGTVWSLLSRARERIRRRLKHGR